MQQPKKGVINMNNAIRILIPAVTAGAVILVTGSTCCLRSMIEPIPEIPEPVYAANNAESRAENAPDQIETNASAEVLLPEALPETGYLLKLNADTLYVFAEGSREPAASFSLPADWLPEYDRILLEYGFRVSDQAELRELLEDYIS